MRLLAAAGTVLLTAHAWVHPGITNSKDDLERLATLAKSDAEPWKSAYEAFAADEHSAKGYELKGLCPYVARTKESATTVCMTDFAHDAGAALQQSLMWIITDDEAYLDNSLEILNEWGKTLKKVNGSDAQLAAGLSGSNFVNAAEIVRHMSDKWAEDDIETFSNMLSTAIYPPAEQHIPSEEQSVPWIANWGTAGAKLVLAAGVFLENQTAIDTAKELMLHS
ncbi:hypothetical protein PRZ48_009085 [Zasmidium cellare]|uniref:Alginate lyase domain-containing protein n=1 Tax=Zasmidium cellare TaxID=395010 RepID=A0ABR0EIC8_ZASCE|nr:hypothetical protein PRZ48_009085 [Zasmidium cellare]